MQKLRKDCPTAKIAVVDPLRTALLDSGANGSSNVTQYHQPATHIFPKEHSVHVQNKRLQYKHALLIATGAHGGVPPHYVLDDSITAHIRELRPTLQLVGRDDHNSSRPIHSPEQVRQRTVDSAKLNESVAILGSGWDAINLAVLVSQEQTRRRKRPSTILLFGASGPASHMLPSYLSAALAKRLSHKIQILDRTLIRYITENPTEGCPRLQIYTARTHDFLESSRHSCDSVTIAPDVGGIRGSAVQATNFVPEFLQDFRNRRSWYLPWSALSMKSSIDPPSIICYKDDGRIVVNTELNACSGVFAAGSVATYANGFTGHSDVAGQGYHDGTEAAVVAANNMILEYQRNIALLSSANYNSSVLVKNPIPVWRSDLCSYSAEKEKTALQGIGVSCLAVGHCDSERFRTHAIWWTNQSAQRRIMNLLDEDISSTEKRQILKSASKSVYGIGVLFYLDRTGRIQGVATWGLPFTDQNDNINQLLVNEMQEILLSNGNFSSVESELDYVRLSKHLEFKSRKLVGLALSKAKESMDGNVNLLQGHENEFPRPLHRLTEVRAASVRSAGLVRRKDAQGQGLHGEDLFSRYDHPLEDSPPPKPVSGVGYADIESKSSSRKSLSSAHNLYEWQLWEQREKRFEENEAIARPAKEDILWIRKGDEVRNTAVRDKIAAAYSAASTAHRFH